MPPGAFVSTLGICWFLFPSLSVCVICVCGGVCARVCVVGCVLCACVLCVCAIVVVAVVVLVLVPVEDAAGDVLCLSIDWPLAFVSQVF